MERLDSEKLFRFIQNMKDRCTLECPNPYCKHKTYIDPQGKEQKTLHSALSTTIYKHKDFRGNVCQYCEEEFEEIVRKRRLEQQQKETIQNESFKKDVADITNNIEYKNYYEVDNDIDTP